jgi:hypothetical protein
MAWALFVVGVLLLIAAAMEPVQTSVKGTVVVAEVAAGTAILVLAAVVQVLG